MRIALACSLALLALAPAQAQIFRHDSHRGSSVHVSVGHGHGHHRHHDHHYGPWRSHHYGFGYYPRSYYVPAYSYYDGYGYAEPYYDYGYSRSGSAAANGLLLGALAGGIIGHNSGEFRHNGWRGAAWGAGAGLLLGSIIDANRARAAAPATPAVVPAAPVVVPAQTQPAPQAQPQQVTIINNYYNSASPMSGANSLFGR